MANKKKLKGFGLKDVLAFLRKGKEREEGINQASAAPAPQEYPINHKAKERHPEEQVFQIVAIIDHGRGVKTYRLFKKDRKNPALFRAGQYVVVRQYIDGKLIARPISISSGIEDAMRGYLDLTIKENPEGYFSPWVISHWKEGGEVTTSGPQGNFYYTSLRDEHHVIAVAGGSGITPILSMAKSIASDDEDFILDIVYCCRSIDDVFMQKDFEAVLKATDKVRLHLCLEKPSEEAEFTGFISKEIIEGIAGNEPYSIFACGPQGMYNHLDKIAVELGLDEKHYRKEIFGIHKDPSKLPGYELIQKDKPLVALIHMCGKDFEIPMRADETIITAMERAGIAGPNRCRGGICGFCRSKLLNGQVYVPEDTDGRRAHDKEKGYIHPCSSFPLTDIELEVPNAK